MALREGMIFGLCNPLLDVTAHVDDAFLKKFNLESNMAILGDEKNFQIYKEMEENYEVEYTLGGATQNTMRCVATLLKHPNVATYMGCVGKDDYSEIMENKAKEIGLKVAYQYTDKNHTGRCAVLVTGKNRSLVAHLGAANNFTIEHLEDPEHWTHIEKAEIHYVSGFFVTVCIDAILKIAEYSNKNNRVFCTNLSATFVSQFYKDRFLQVIPHVNILFGNNDEAIAFSKYVLGKETTDIRSIAQEISKLPSVTGKQRLVIITQGPDPVIVAEGDDVREFPVPKIDDDKVVDTNGAGDCFVAGFFSQYVKKLPLEKCIECGIWISEKIVQVHGVVFPDNLEYPYGKN